MINKKINIHCSATQHAYDRAKERMKWKPKTLNRMMRKAFNEGISQKEAKGALKKYLVKLWFDYKSCNNIRIYGENIFFFNNHVLVTLHRLKQNLVKYLQDYK